MTFTAWLYMAVFSDGSSLLTAADFSSLKYFTVLSNLFNGMICLHYAGKYLAGRPLTGLDRILKLTGTTAVGVTFVTVVFFLGPLYGYWNMIQGANLWLHLILPLASFFTFIVLEDHSSIPPGYTAAAMIPTFLYGAGYLGNIFINGIGSWPDTNDFYGFLHWGSGVGALIAVAMLLGTWMIAMILRSASIKVKKMK